MRSLVVIVLFGMVALFAAGARGATVTATLVTGQIGGPAYHSVEVVGGPEGDDLAVAVRDREVEITDPAASLEVTGCAAADAHRAVCTLEGTAPLRVLRVSGGPGDDRIVLTGTVGGTLMGDAGADLVIGGDGGDELTGGGGADELHGGAGDDHFVVGVRTEERDGSEVAGDAVDGGAGRDTLELHRLRSAISVDLAARTAVTDAGAASIGGIEDVDADRVPVTLLGDDGPNRLAAYGFPSTIDGRGGDDLVVGSSAADVLRGGDGADGIVFTRGDDVNGGAGDDVLSGDATTSVPRGAAEPPLACGPGRDAVQAPVERLVPRDCERLQIARVGQVLKRTVERRRRSVRLDLALQTGACGVTVDVRGVDGTALTARRRAAARDRLSLRLSLTRAGRRRAASGRLGSVVLVVRAVTSCPRRGSWNGGLRASFLTTLS